VGFIDREEYIPSLVSGFIESLWAGKLWQTSAECIYIQNAIWRVIPTFPSKFGVNHRHYII